METNLIDKSKEIFTNFDNKDVTKEKTDENKHKENVTEMKAEKSNITEINKKIEIKENEKPLKEEEKLDDEKKNN